MFETGLLDECDHVEEGLLYVSVRHHCYGEVDNLWIFCLYNREFIINDSKFRRHISNDAITCLYSIDLKFLFYSSDIINA